MKKQVRTSVNKIEVESSSVPLTGDRPVSRHHYEFNLFEVGRLLLDRRKWIFGIVIPVMLLAAGKLLMTPNVYMSRATILPSGKTSDFSSIKELVGLGGGIGMVDENSSALYPLILQSDLIKDSVLTRTYDIEFKGEPLRIVPSKYFGRTDPHRLRKALAGATNIIANKRNGEIYVAVETEYPELSRALVTEYLRQLETYNHFVRKSSARENQRYLEQRLTEAGRDLAQAEEEVRLFREANSNWAASTNADILDELTRLERELQIKSTAYLFLQQQLESAKFNARKDIPIIRVLDQPSLPTIKSGPKRTITVLLAGMIAFMLTVLGIFFADLWKQFTGGPNKQEYAEFQDQFNEAFPRSTRALTLIKRSMNKRNKEVSV